MPDDDKFSKKTGQTISDLNYAKEVVSERVNHPDRFENIFKEIEVLSGGNGHILCSYTIPKHLSNTHGSLHGGMIATLVDAVSTYALSTATKHHRHISMDLSVSYMRKAQLGETITIEGNTDKLGGRVAFLTATLRDKSGKLIATGKHTKLILETDIEGVLGLSTMTTTLAKINKDQKELAIPKQIVLRIV